jgi:hypothetical protein
MPSRRWYCIHCGQTFVSSDSDTCSLCRKSGGLVDPDAPVALRDLVQKKQEIESNPGGAAEGVASGAVTALLAWRVLRCFVGGIVMLVLAGFLVFHPGLRSDPHGVSFSDFLVALGPMLAGVFLLFVALVNWRQMTG